MNMEEASPEKDCACSCECECCREGQCQGKNHRKEGIFWQMRMNDTVGATFLGTLALFLLVFLVRSNRRNRELLLEVIELRRQA